MLHTYLTEVYKNIRSHLLLSVIIVLLFTFLIQILSYSFAWVTYNFWNNREMSSSFLNNEAYIEYSVYSLRFSGDINIAQELSDIFSTTKLQQNPDDPSIFMIVPLTDEELAAKEVLVKETVESYLRLSEKLNDINGVIISNRHLSNGFHSEDGKAYALSREAARNMKSSAVLREEETGYYSGLGYSAEEIRRFCTYQSSQIDIGSILMEGFSYCEGDGFTEENLKFEYTLTEDKQIPTIPVVMGYDFHEYYNIGDVLLNYDTRAYLQDIKDGVDARRTYLDQNYAQYKIVGFLSPETNIEYSPGTRINIDDQVIIPFIPTTPEYFPEETDTTYAREFYQNLLQATLILYVEKDFETETEAALSKAFSEDTVIGPYVRIEKNEQANAVYSQMLQKRMINYALIAGATLIFCIGVIILIIINKFSANTKDTAIHRLIGSTSSDIVKTYVLEFAIYLLCADILSHYVYILYAINPLSVSLIGFWMTLPINGVEIRMIYPLMIAVNILFLCIVALIARICSSRLDIATIIKGKE